MSVRLRFPTGVIALAAAACLAAPAASRAAPLAPGQTLFPLIAEPDPVGGTILATQTVPVTATTFTGTLTSTVIQGDASNPLGGLTFTYRFTNTDADAVPSSINRLTFSSYNGLLVDASYQAGLGVAPAYVDRGLGEEVGFSFIGPPLGTGTLAPGTSSALLVLQTNSPTFVQGAFAAIDGSVAQGPAFAPVPEPASVGVIGLASAALLARRRRRRGSRA
jgi:hypothetical protein